MCLLNVLHSSSRVMQSSIGSALASICSENSIGVDKLLYNFTMILIDKTYWYRAGKQYTIAKINIDCINGGQTYTAGKEIKADKQLTGKK